MDTILKRRLIEAQKSEITEYHVYRTLAKHCKDPHNKDVLERIADDEKRHYDYWGTHTCEKPGPRPWQRLKFVLIARFLGLTFAVKLMEKGEEQAQINYEEVAQTIPEALKIMQEEDEHEHQLLNILDEEVLQYVGSVVLGLSDALVELTGALAGLTLALQNSRLIAMIGLVTGIAASMSMAASEYLSTKSEEEDKKSPLKASLYTGVAYVVTVTILIAPFLLLGSPLAALGISLFSALVIIYLFTFYISVAKDQDFKHRFFEMAGLSLGVAAISSFIGYLLRVVFDVEA